MSGAKAPEHTYSGLIEWTGNTGHGTSDYSAYSREYRVCFDGKTALAGSADPAFRGRPDLHNPEELFLASIAACHMLFWLSLCARNGIRALSYEDRPVGRLTLDAQGGGRFSEIVLRPVATIASGDDSDRALELHALAKERCFIANSCAVPILHEPVVRAADANEPMCDLQIDLDDRAGALAAMGEALGRAGVSIEGGAAFVAGGRGVAHFLFRDGAAARQALEQAGIRVVAERSVVAQRLDQGMPGQLGLVARRMVDAGVNIEVLYSDHDHRLMSWWMTRRGGGDCADDEVHESCHVAVNGRNPPLTRGVRRGDTADVGRDAQHAGASRHVRPPGMRTNST
ncbi:MAG TPA: OsmC family protein [Longimicrobiales bacterium]|nr:OsmC family protein [Longimicrobiales bacterium]